MSRRPLPLAAALAAGLLTGCGLANPYANPGAQTAIRTAITESPTTDHDPRPERGGAIPKVAARHQAAVTAAAGQATQVAAVRRYARLYVNWDATDVATQQSELASISVEVARAQALQAAASYRHDSTLHKSQVANSGNVVAITRGEGTAANYWVVVTQETTTGKGDYQGLPAQLHITYAQLTRTATGWVISSWSPQT
jgi:hypothetical protein